MNTKRIFLRRYSTTRYVMLLIGMCFFSPTVSASLILDAASFALNFQAAGFQAPTIIMNETESTFDLAITGSLVDYTFGDNTASFTESFTLNFWRGSVTFGQVDGQINPDSVTASINMYHQAGINRPHPGDALKGGIFTFPSRTLRQGDPAVSFGTLVSHPGNGHNDNYYDGLFSVAGNNNNITGWNYNLKAVHVVPIPATVWLFGSGLLGLIGIARRKRA